MTCAFCFRRTFIDFGPDSLKDVRLNRSCSAPPWVHRFDDGIHRDAKASKEIASWLERAKHLHAQETGTHGAVLVEHPSDDQAESHRVAAEVTTLMVGGIPSRLKLQGAIEMINDQGFANAYDLVYMPRYGSAASRKNLGYMFVNFKKPEGAAAFAKAFRDFCMPHRTSKKCCFTKPASCQGFEANVKMHTAQGQIDCDKDVALATFR